jgi:hypothetical protein
MWRNAVDAGEETSASNRMVSSDDWDAFQSVSGAGAGRVESDNWRLASGTAEEMQRLTQAFAVYVEPEAGTLSDGLCTALIGRDGIIRNLWRGNAWRPEEVLAALREVENGRK